MFHLLCSSDQVSAIPCQGMSKPHRVCTLLSTSEMLMPNQGNGQMAGTLISTISRGRPELLMPSRIPRLLMPNPTSNELQYLVSFCVTFGPLLLRIWSGW